MVYFLLLAVNLGAQLTGHPFAGVDADAATLHMLTVQDVASGTGAMSGRYADAVIMSLWPSRGLELHGVEIKVSRSDWKREAADPTKAEAIAKYCDRWWIHTPPGIVSDLSELPPAWGLREFNGKSWATIREAAKTAAEPVGRRFLGALLRRGDEGVRVLAKASVEEERAALQREAESRRDQFQAEVDVAVRRRTESLEKASENVRAFEEAFGSAAGWDCHPKAWGAASRALADCAHGYGPLVKRLRKAADEIEARAALKETGHD